MLFGPNGIGKSTLVQMMSTRGFPSEGTVDILGNRLGKVNVFSYRNRIGLSSAELGRAFPPQEDPLDAIVTALTATTGRWRDTYTDEDYAKARSLMREFGIEYGRQDDIQAFRRRTHSRAYLPCVDGGSRFADS